MKPKTKPTPKPVVKAYIKESADRLKGKPARMPNGDRKCGKKKC